MVDCAILCYLHMTTSFGTQDAATGGARQANISVTLTGAPGPATRGVLLVCE